MPSKLYHKEIWMPPSIRALHGVTMALNFTVHAQKAAEEDRYGLIKIPSHITFDGSDVVEAEENEGKVTKLVIRLPYDISRDVIYVVTSDRTLKTVWTNQKSDVHASLNRSRYVSAPKNH